MQREQLVCVTSMSVLLRRLTKSGERVDSSVSRLTHNWVSHSSFCSREAREEAQLSCATFGSRVLVDMRSPELYGEKSKSAPRERLTRIPFRQRGA